MKPESVRTWRELIAAEMAEHGETQEDLIATAPADRIFLDTEFDSGWGGSEGAPFTAWTAKRVYFPAVYDGSEWVESVPRDPCDEVTAHIGGE